MGILRTFKRRGIKWGLGQYVLTHAHPVPTNPPHQRHLADETFFRQHQSEPTLSVLINSCEIDESPLQKVYVKGISDGHFLGCYFHLLSSSRF